MPVSCCCSWNSSLLLFTCLYWEVLPSSFVKEGVSPTWYVRREGQEARRESSYWNNPLLCDRSDWLNNNNNNNSNKSPLSALAMAKPEENTWLNPFNVLTPNSINNVFCWLSWACLLSTRTSCFHTWTWCFFHAPLRFSDRKYSAGSKYCYRSDTDNPIRELCWQSRMVVSFPRFPSRAKEKPYVTDWHTFILMGFRIYMPFILSLSWLLTSSWAAAAATGGVGLSSSDSW